MRIIGTKLLFAATATLIATACGTQTQSNVQEARFETICTFQDNIFPIYEPISLSMADDGRIAMADGNGVYLYSSDGRQISKIGDKGNASFEYNRPSIVRISGDAVYVWSSNSLHFIKYGMDGTPRDYCRYQFAIGDFRPVGDSIFIYNLGNNEESVIDVLDTKTKTVTGHLAKSSLKHIALSHLDICFPVHDAGNIVYYCPKDRMEVNTFDLSARKTASLPEIKSKSFITRELPIGFDDGDVERWREYIRENSQTLGIFPGRNGNLHLLALEGVTKVKDGKYDSSERVYSIYDIATKTPVARYSYLSFGKVSLLTVTNDGLYVVEKSIENDNDVYTLKKLVI